MYEKPRENLTQVAQFTRREGGRATAPKNFFWNFLKNFFKKFFLGSYYRVAGRVRFTTLLKENFEILSAMEW